MKKTPFIIFIILSFAFLFFGLKQAYAATSISYDSTQPSGTQVADSNCNVPFTVCWNSEAVGTSSCGTACTGGSAWTKYQYSACIRPPGSLSDFIAWLPRLTDTCSTGDKYNSSNTSVMKAGRCGVISGACEVGGDYKTCCSGTTPVAARSFQLDPYAPDEADCGGNSTVRCGGAGEPACGQAACNTLAPPANLTTPSSSINGTLYEDGSVNFGATVRNTGGLSAGSSNTQFRVCAGNNDCGDGNSPIALGTPSTVSLGPGFSTTVTSNTWSNIPRGTYSLRVWADINSAVSESNELDNGNWRTVCVEGKPDSPSLISPSNGSSGNSITPTLFWTFNSFNNVCANSMGYRVDFGTTNPPPAGSSIIYQNQTTGTYNPGTLSGNTTYYWRVVKCNGLSCTFGPVWSFSTAAGATPTPTNTPTPTPTPPPGVTIPPTPTPTIPPPCQVTTQPRVHNLTVGGAGTITATVTGLPAGKTISQMLFGSYKTAIATVNPTSDPSSPYSTIVTGVACGATAVWATAQLNDGDTTTCQSTGSTDTDVNVSCPTTPTPTPTPTPTTIPTPTLPPGNGINMNGNSDCVGATPRINLWWNSDTGDWNFGIFRNGVEQDNTGAMSWSSTDPAKIGNSGDTFSWRILGRPSNTWDNQNGILITTATCAGPTPTSGPTNTPRPTSTPRPTPTLTPTYRISGAAYVDSNKNGVQEGPNRVQDSWEQLCTPSDTENQRENCEDSGARCIGGDEGTGPCWFDVYQEQGYSGATVRRSGSSTPTTTSSLGRYSFSGLLAGSYTITLTVPTGFSATTSNPVRTSVGPNSTVNFGIISGIECSDGIDNDGDGLIDAVDPGCHTDGNPFNRPSYNPNGPSEVEVASTPTPTPTPLILSGAAVIDSSGNNCASGTTPYTGSATVTTYNSGGSQTGSDGTDGSGAYLISDSTAPGQKTAVISNIAGFQARRVRFDNGGWTTSGLSGFTYGPFNFSANHTLDWCIDNVRSWFQTTTGDVRMNNLINRVPSGKYASEDTSNPSIFYSSNFATEFGSGRSSQEGWAVNDEYTYQDDSKNRNGSMSYSFYVSRIAQQNVTTNNIPGCTGGDCSVGIANLSTGAYHLNNGNLTITSYSHRAGARTLLLVNGDVTIRSNISVPTGSLLIIAAKGDITIDRTIGTTNPSATTPNIDGILTAEKSIILDGASCSGGSPDRRLNVGGSLIANSLKPFQVGASGALVNNRSLCQQDVNYPSLYVSSRYDFVTQLTDFYKTAYTRWREVAP